MKLTDRFIGKVVTDPMGRRYGIITGVHESYSNMLQVVYWEPQQCEYVTDYWEVAAVIRVPFYELENDKDPNRNDLQFEAARRMAFADAAVAIHDKELFEEAFAAFKPAREKIPKSE